MREMSSFRTIGTCQENGRCCSSQSVPLFCAQSVKNRHMAEVSVCLHVSYPKSLSMGFMEFGIEGPH
jgi:hypothetical protein